METWLSHGVVAEKTGMEIPRGSEISGGFRGPPVHLKPPFHSYQELTMARKLAFARLHITPITCDEKDRHRSQGIHQVG